MDNLEIGVKEMIDVLVDWNIKHQWRVYNDNKRIEGCCNPNNRTIYLSDDSFLAEKQYTLLHELLHAYDFNRGILSKERGMTGRTNELYKKIYGHNFVK